MKSALQEEYINHADKSLDGVNKATKLVESLSHEDTFLKSRISAEELYSECDNTKAECGTGNSSPESSSTSFSGFSSSSAGSESSDDILVSDSISSVDSRKSYEHVSADIACRISEKNCNADIPDPMKQLSPKFASLVDSVNGFTSSGTLNQSKSGYDGRQVQCNSNSPPLSGDSTRHEVPLSKRSAVPDIWEGVADSTEQKDRVENCPESLMSCGTNINDESDSISTLRFSFNLLGNNIPPLCKQACEKASGDALPAEKHHGDSVSPDEMRRGGVNTIDFPPVKYEKIKRTNEGSSSNSSTDSACCLKPREIGSSSCQSSYDSAVASSRIGVITENTNAKSLGQSPSSTNRMMDQAISNVNRNLIRNQVVSSSSAPDKRTVPKSENQSALLVRSGKCDGIDKHVATLSQDTVSSVNPRNGLKMSVWRVIDQLKGSVLSRYNLSGDMVDVDRKCNEKVALIFLFFHPPYLHS